MMFLRCAMWRYWIKRRAKFYTRFYAQRFNSVLHTQWESRLSIVKSLFKHIHNITDDDVMRSKSCAKVQKKSKERKKNFLLLPETSSCSRIPSRSIVWWRLHCAKLAARLLTKGSRQCRLIPFLLLPPSIEPSSSFIHDSHREPNTTRSERKKRRKPEQTLLYVNVDISYPWRLEHSAENIQHATLAFTPQVSKLSARCSRVSQWSTVEQSKPSCSHSVPRISFIFFVEWETLFFRFVFLVSYSYCEHFYGHELKLL